MHAGIPGCLKSTQVCSNASLINIQCIDGHYSLSVSDRRVVILGKTGAGKSSLANTIFGEDLLFNTSHTINSETKRCQAETRSLNGGGMTLIDTPGVFDTDRPEEELKREIVRCITECAPGPHAFLILLKVEKFTKQEQDVINIIHQYFSEEVFKYATIVFTYGDQLEEGEKIEDFVCNNKSMRDLVEKCGGRCHVIDNKYWKNKQQDEYRSNKYQVKELLKTIDKVTEANKGRCYTNEMLQVVEKEIQQEEKLIRQSPGNMSEEEITRQAKDRAFKKIWIRLAGVGTGALLGALFGAVAMVGSVVYALKVLVPVAKAAVLASAGAAGAGGTAAGVAAAGADFLTNRPQSVRMGPHCSSTLTHSTGAPQGCVLSPFLYSLYTHDCVPSHNATTVVKFADDTTVVGLITKGDESTYREEVQGLTVWCRENNLTLNIKKTKELIIDFRKKQDVHLPLYINGERVERVPSFKFLGTHITEDLTWTVNTTALVKRAHQ
ncbi:uncharacterized protein LOC126404710 [Epinephelus moara]|uniref:uncharacterized protein LOC126404710 n=1 Tax=Epinephelus moara TaxID=300413 RepID=UPI00214EB567|nr:uncharacterized protein LOC126404710 [Epinephelus moara]